MISLSRLALALYINDIDFVTKQCVAVICVLTGKHKFLASSVGLMSTISRIAVDPTQVTVHNACTLFASIPVYVQTIFMAQ